MYKGNELKIRRALFSVSNKDGIIELAQALQNTGTEIIATGRTAQVLLSAGIKVVPIEEITGNPEAFQGRMKTLSFPVCSGILYRRGNTKDEEDLKHLQIKPIDCVVVNFYPFEDVAARTNIELNNLVEEIDIGGPTLVRAAAKNSPDVLVLTNPKQYSSVIQELNQTRTVQCSTVTSCAADAWDLVLHYDSAISREFGGKTKKKLRYGENPHQTAHLEIEKDAAIAWDEVLTSNELSYNNILDLSAAYDLANNLVRIFPGSTGVVIIKHNNPCGVALVPRALPQAQKLALLHAWEGDPVSAFGGVILFTDPIQIEVAEWLSSKFVELISAPQLSSSTEVLNVMLEKRKKLKAVSIRKFGEVPKELVMNIPGGKLVQSIDSNINEELNIVTRKQWSEDKRRLSQFGIAVCRALKSNAIAIVREVTPRSQMFQLVGAGQGQPNRIDALKTLAVPRALAVLQKSEGVIEECVMVSDAFFPFRDAVDAAYSAGIRWIVQPGGSVKDSDSISACDDYDMSMAFTGMRHFRH